MYTFEYFINYFINFYLDTKKQKRTRIHYTNYQIFILESIFQNNRYLSRIMRERLANELGITEKQVKIWFQNRRTKKMSI